MKPFSALSSFSFSHPVISGLLFIGSITVGVLLCTDSDKKSIDSRYHSPKEYKSDFQSIFEINDNVARDITEAEMTNSRSHTDNNIANPVNLMGSASNIEDRSSFRDSIGTCIINHKYEIATGCFIFAAAVGYFYVAGWAQQTDILSLLRKIPMKQAPVSDGIAVAPNSGLEYTPDTELLLADDICSEKVLVNVKLHPRKLPAGHRPSPEKIHEAQRLGINLEEGYTLVDAYNRSISVASAA